jgi:hypothetical protein
MKRKTQLTESELTNLIKRMVSEDLGPGSMIPTTGQRPIPTTGQGPRPTTGQGPIPTTGQNRPMRPIKKITPVIEVDCNRKVILSSQLPKLGKDANYTIINYYCNKQ